MHHSDGQAVATVALLEKHAKTRLAVAADHFNRDYKKGFQFLQVWVLLHILVASSVQHASKGRTFRTGFGTPMLRMLAGGALVPLSGIRFRTPGRSNALDAQIPASLPLTIAVTHTGLVAEPGGAGRCSGA